MCCFVDSLDHTYGKMPKFFEQYEGYSLQKNIQNFSSYNNVQYYCFQSAEIIHGGFLLRFNASSIHAIKLCKKRCTNSHGEERKRNKTEIFFISFPLLGRRDQCTVFCIVSFDFKVHLNPKYFFRLNKSLHLFETHFVFLNLILTFL